TVIAENLVRPFMKDVTDQQLLRIMRVSVVVVAAMSAMMALRGSTIYELVGLSSALSLVSLFVPLIAGLYWRRASQAGALLSMGFGMAAWLWFEFVFPSEIPSLIYGLMFSIFGMLAGSMARTGRGPLQAR
ncbi:MAG: sodium:solute symporter, partial [Gammaproteobacteria bacterium]|nr:sodium:solute symporter [Gammaproteobacteria bacterium]